MEPQELEIVRRAFAKHVMAAAEIDDLRLEAAFAAVPREEFLGPGPWPTALADPTPRLCGDPECRPGPPLHQRRCRHPPRTQSEQWRALAARCADCGAAPQPGEHIVHIGAGVGYYTAVMAELVGRAGQLPRSNSTRPCGTHRSQFLAFPECANRRGRWHQGRIRPRRRDLRECRSDTPRAIMAQLLERRRPADFAADRKGISDGDARHGGVRIERRGGEFSARRISRVAIFPCEGARDEATRARALRRFR